MKKLSLCFYILLATVLTLWMYGELFMRVVLPMKISQRFVQQRAEQLLGRNVHIGSVGMGWTHFKLDGMRVESANPSAEKSFLSVKRVRAYWSFFALLRGKIKIASLAIVQPALHLVRYEDGTWNIPGDFATEQAEQSEQPQTTGAPAVDVYIKHFSLTDGAFSLTDLAAQQRVEISNLYIGTRNLQWAKPFTLNINAALAYAQAEQPQQVFNIGLAAKLNLADFKQEEMSAQLQPLLISHAGGRVELRGEFHNAAAPHIVATLTGRDLSQQLIAWAAPQVPAFSIEKLELTADAVADLARQEVTASSLTLQGLGSVLSGKGSGRFGQKPVFSADGNFDLDLESIGKAVAMLADYRLAGHLQGQVQGTQEDVSADVTAQAVAAKVPGAGNLSDINFTLAVPNKNQGRLTDLTGKINDGPFTGSLLAQRTKRGVEVDMKFSSPRVALPPLAKNTEPQQDAVPTLPKNEAATTDLPPFFVKAAVDINSLDAPFMYGENIIFRADLGQLSTALDKAKGTLSLGIGKGEIKDLAQLTNANILTGVLFSSLDVVGRVINSLNVLSVLNVFGGEEGEDRSDDMVVQTILDENGEEQHILVPYEPGAYGDIWKFKSFATDIRFADGVGDITKGLFRSDRMSFNLTGKMNFKTRGLDMNVQAAPGLHEEDGVMPLSLRIGGTMENPQGSMRMLSSMTSILTQGVGNNFASRTVKKGVSGVVGLFKKKADEEEGAQDMDTADADMDTADTAAPADRTDTADANTDSATKNAPAADDAAAGGPSGPPPTPEQ